MSDNDEDDFRRGYRPSGELVPIPDPTRLTLEVVALAKKEIEKLFDTKIGHVDEDLKRIEQILAEMSGIENSKRDRLHELLEQKFIGVATEFTMRDIALAGTTLASEKLSGSFTKQIDNLNEKIDGLKENINEISRKNWSAVGGYIVGAVGIAALIIAAIYHSPVH
jgi:flagellar biosynthesis chaperone FliJ